jgi:hypothetical protein
MLVLERRSMGFIHSLARSDNAYLRKCLQLAVGGSRPALWNSIVAGSTPGLDFCNKYDIEKADLLTRRIDIKHRGMWHYRNDENLARKGDQIRELLEISRRDYGCDFLTRGEIDVILEYNV